MIVNGKSSTGAKLDMKRDVGTVACFRNRRRGRAKAQGLVLEVIRAVGGDTATRAACPSACYAGRRRA